MDDRVDMLIERYDPRPPSPRLVQSYAEGILRDMDDPSDLADMIVDKARERDVDLGELAASTFKLADRKGIL